MYTVFIISPSTASSLVKVELSLAKRLNFVLMKQQNVFIARGFLNCSTFFFFTVCVWRILYGLFFFFKLSPISGTDSVPYCLKVYANFRCKNVKMSSKPKAGADAAFFKAAPASF